MKKQKAPKKSLRQKIADKLANKLRPYVENYVQDHDNLIIEQVCNRIRFLSLQGNFDVETLINDLKNGGYKNDEKEHISNN